MNMSKESTAVTGGIMLCQMKAGNLRTKKVTLSSDGSGSLLKEASEFSQAPEDQIILTYQGRIIKKDEEFDVLNIVDGGLIMVTEVPAPKKREVPVPKDVTPEDIKRFLIAFKTALKSPSFTKVVKRLVEKENMENLCAACPGLEDDQLSQAFLTKPDLLTHLCDPEVLKRMAETHPCLMEAANNLAAAVHEEQQSAGKTSSSTAEPQEIGAAGSGGSYYLDEMSDEEMDTDDGGLQRQRRRSTGAGAGITPSQLAQALAMASGIGQGGANFNPFAGVTGLGVGNNSQQQQHQGQSGSSGSAPSSASARITANMFQQAMQQALQNASGGNASQQQQPASGQEQQDDIAAKVERMKEMGIIDEGLALQALQIMGGDLQAAVDLIFSGWEGGDEAMS